VGGEARPEWHIQYASCDAGVFVEELVELLDSLTVRDGTRGPKGAKYGRVLLHLLSLIQIQE